MRVVNAWHQPEPTDTILCTIAAVRFFFCTAPSVTEVRCVALGCGRPGGAQLQGRVCRPLGQCSHCVRCLGKPQQQSRAELLLTPHVGAGKCSVTLPYINAGAISHLNIALRSTWRRRRAERGSRLLGLELPHVPHLRPVPSGFLWFLYSRQGGEPRESFTVPVVQVVPRQFSFPAPSLRADVKSCLHLRERFHAVQSLTDAAAPSAPCGGGGSACGGSGAACFPRATHGRGPDAGSGVTRRQPPPLRRGSRSRAACRAAPRPSHSGAVLGARRAAGVPTSAGAAPRSRWSCGSGVSRAVGWGLCRRAADAAGPRLGFPGLCSGFLRTSAFQPNVSYLF